MRRHPDRRRRPGAPPPVQRDRHLQAAAAPRRSTAYLASGEWRGKAGGYAIQGRAEALIRALSGSYSGVMGLPFTRPAPCSARRAIRLAEWLLRGGDRRGPRDPGRGRHDPRGRDRTARRCAPARWSTATLVSAAGHRAALRDGERGGGRAAAARSARAPASAPRSSARRSRSPAASSRHGCARPTCRRVPARPAPSAPAAARPPPGPDPFEAAGWSELLEEAATGEIAFHGRRAADEPDPGHDPVRRRRQRSRPRRSPRPAPPRRPARSAASASPARSAWTCPLCPTRPAPGRRRDRRRAPSPAVRAHRGERLRLPADRPPPRPPVPPRAAARRPGRRRRPRPAAPGGAAAGAGRACTPRRR